VNSLDTYKAILKILYYIKRYDRENRT
jgi:hypothetical protein